MGVTSCSVGSADTQIEIYATPLQFGWGKGKVPGLISRQRSSFRGPYQADYCSAPERTGQVGIERTGKPYYSQAYR